MVHARSLIIVGIGAAVLSALLFSSVKDVGEPRLSVKQVAFADLPGWENDSLTNFLDAYARSCTRLDQTPNDAPFNAREMLGDSEIPTLSGSAAPWRRACGDIEAAVRSGHSLRDAIEASFTPISMQTATHRASLFGIPWFAQTSRTGLATGYFEPSYDGSLTHTEEFSTPLRKRPDDLVMVDLGAFREDLAGQRIAGRVVNGRLTPFEDRADIEARAPVEGEAIAWLSPTDAFFLQIQGSGRIRLQEGGVLRVGYAGQNGHIYTPVGRVLIERGEMTLEDVSMQSIRQWLRSAGQEEARALMNENASFVYFEARDVAGGGEGPFGGSGAALTALRSVAIDPVFIPYGAPVWIDAETAEGWGGRLQRLFVAQDEGGAIKGPLRADIFWGAGVEAGEAAGGMRADMQIYLLVPNALAEQIKNGSSQR